MLRSSGRKGVWVSDAVFAGDRWRGFYWCELCLPLGQAHPNDHLVVLDALTYAGNRASLAPLEGSGAFTLSRVISATRA